MGMVKQRVGKPFLEQGPRIPKYMHTISYIPLRTRLKSLLLFSLGLTVFPSCSEATLIPIRD